MIHQECISCGERYEIDEIVYSCKGCASLLEVKYDYDVLGRRIKNRDYKKIPLSVWRYKDLLPISDPSKIVSLHEGGTGLHSCSRLGAHLGLKHLYVKNEGENPTGSFKDRGMTVGITRALELNAKTVICASTGNTSAALAAYAAKAGLQCIVLIPSGKIAYGKLAQAMVYGAKVVQLRGNFDHALNTVLKISEKHGDVYLLNSVNPYRIEGQKTLAYEICDQMGGEPPDKVVLPVGNAGNISALWKGFKEFQILGVTNKLPEMTGIQAEGSAPIAHAIKNRKEAISPINNPETIATAIRIGAPISWRKALNAIRESKGTAETVTDEELLKAQKLIARSEGLFVEPASAASIAGVKKLVEMGEIHKDEVVVCVTTGHGLKDPDTAIKISEKPSEADSEIEVLPALLALPSTRGPGAL